MRVWRIIYLNSVGLDCDSSAVKAIAGCPSRETAALVVG